jgi:adenylosuccinate lyase
LAGVVERLDVRAERMAENLARMGDAIFSEQVLLALVRRGVARDQAYRWVQRHGLAGGAFAERLAEDADVRRHLTAAEIAGLFDIDHHLRHIDVLFDRALAEGDGPAE